MIQKDKKNHTQCCDCPEIRKKIAAYTDKLGEKNLCSQHARIAGTYTTRYPCRDCPTNQTKQASFRDENGKQKQLCAKHARHAGTYKILHPCRDCPDGRQKHAAFSDESNNPNRLCATHAREAGTYKILRPCRDCPEHNKKNAAFSDEFGNPTTLCVLHAREVQSYTVLHPCRDCPEHDKKYANFKDDSGKPNQLCAEHAVLAGLKCATITGVSKIACECWDLLQAELNCFSDTILQHMHYDEDAENIFTGTEYKIPGTNLRVDAHDKKNNAIYEFLGNAWHGYPPGHALYYSLSTRTGLCNDILYMKTIERLKKIKRILPNTCLFYIWEHTYRQQKKKKSCIRQHVREFLLED